MHLIMQTLHDLVRGQLGTTLYLYVMQLSTSPIVELYSTVLFLYRETNSTVPYNKTLEENSDCDYYKQIEL